MKNYIKNGKFLLVALSLSLALFVTSCGDDPDEFTYLTAKDTPFYHFGGAAQSDTIALSILQTTTTPLKVSLVHSAHDYSSPVSVPFTISGPEASYTVVDGATSFEFAAGEAESSIEIMPVLNQPSSVLYITANPSDGASVGYPGGNYARVVKVTILVCPTNYGLWFGNLDIQDVGYPPSYGGVGSATPDATCDILVVDSDLPNSGQTPDNTVFELVFTPIAPGATAGTVEVEPTKYINSLNFSSGAYAVYYKAQGTYDESTATITLNYTVTANNIDTGAEVGTWYTGLNVIQPL